MANKKLKCSVCGWKWKPRMVIPVECPRCKSRRWRNNNGKHLPKTSESGTPRSTSRSISESITRIRDLKEAV